MKATQAKSASSISAQELKTSLEKNFDVQAIERPSPKDIEVHREVSERVWLEPAFGHSPGNFSVLAEGGGQRAIFWGDVIHHPVQLIRPELMPSFDGDPEKARQTRLRTLARAADEELICFPAHFRDPSAGRVLRAGDTYRYGFLDR